jgi:hypothetical protein
MPIVRPRAHVGQIDPIEIGRISFDGAWNER